MHYDLLAIRSTPKQGTTKDLCRDRGLAYEAIGVFAQRLPSEDSRAQPQLDALLRGLRRGVRRPFERLPTVSSFDGQIVIALAPRVMGRVFIWQRCYRPLGRLQSDPTACMSGCNLFTSVHTLRIHLGMQKSAHCLPGQPQLSPERLNECLLILQVTAVWLADAALQLQHPEGPMYAHLNKLVGKRPALDLQVRLPAEQPAGTASDSTSAIEAFEWRCGVE